MIDVINLALPFFNLISSLRLRPRLEEAGSRADVNTHQLPLLR